MSWRARLLCSWLSLSILGGAACTPEPKNEPIEVIPLDQASYESAVHPVFEHTCGSVDCHGKEPRGLRVYGQASLRLPGLAPGAPTTEAEMAATYQSIIGLEPEKLNAFLSATPRTADEAYKLLLLAKPLAIERHRPGVSLRKGEPAEKCILSWLMSQVDHDACATR
jgi:hypothetical protein